MHPRRRATLSLLACAAVAPSTARAQGASDPIVQPGEPTPAAFLKRAFEMRDLGLRNGDQGYGAVVVRDGRIVGQAPSRTVTATDPTAHAEIEAIRDAARRLRTRDLSGAILYSSFRPCSMCETAAHWANVARLVHGEAGTDAGAPRTPRY